jgi:PleD family two-component response regulator
MLKDSTLQTPEKIPHSRRKFFVRIMVRKPNRAKRKIRKESAMGNNKKQDILGQLRQEIEKNLKEIEQKKSKIEELTESTIEELIKIQGLSQEAQKLQGENSVEEKERSTSATKFKPLNEKNNNGLELGYELANMKMIRKILDLSVALDEEQRFQKKRTQKQKKRVKHPRKKDLKAEKRGIDSPKKILIIEDDIITTKIISHILGQNNFVVGSSQDAEDGLKKVLKEKPDLILLDIMLPGMDGYQLLTRLKANRETSHIPVIILSSLAGERDVIKGLEKGASDYVLKPFSPQILFFKIKKTLALKNEHFTDYHHL